MKKHVVGLATVAVLLSFVVMPAWAAGTVTVIYDPDGYTCSQPTFIDFEAQAHELNLSEAGAINGVQFTASGEYYPWRVEDLGMTGGKWPDGAYMAQGMKVAWLGRDQGRIDFAYGNASYFSLLTSVAGQMSLQAYDVDDNLLDTAGPAGPNLDTGHMHELAISRTQPDIAYVLVLGEWVLVVDAICTDAPASRSAVHIVVPSTIDTGDKDPFTATGPAVDAGTVCPTGDVSDLEVIIRGNPGRNVRILRILKHFKCGDGSGTFDMRLVVRLDLTPYANPRTTGRWRVVRGTGRYAQLRGIGGLIGTTIVNAPESVLDTYDGRMR